MTDFDIEDIGEKRAEFDDLIGISNSSDADAIEENIEASDFALSVDLFGDDLNGEEVDPATIDPLVFVPKIAPDFHALQKRIVQIVDNVDPALKPGLIKSIILELAKNLHTLHLRELIDILHNIQSKKQA